jgi:hypothetical protein
LKLLVKKYLLISKHIKHTQMSLKMSVDVCINILLTTAGSTSGCAALAVLAITGMALT